MRTATMGLIALLLMTDLGVVSLAGAEEPTAATWPGKQSEWRGYTRYDFPFAGKKAYVVVPKEVRKGRPWVWRARFPGFHAEADLLLLQRGFHVAHLDTGGMLGSDRALDLWDQFYLSLTADHGLSKKAVLEGVSRGGLFVYRWAARHPDRVACIYADTPVCDFKSWPLGQGSGVGSQGVWQTLLKEYELSEQQALDYKQNPIDVLSPIAAAKIPVLHLVSLNDKVVPPAENTFVLAKRYRELGGTMEIIEVKEGTERSQGHHFTHPDPKRVADFIQRQVERGELD